MDRIYLSVLGILTLVLICSSLAEQDIGSNNASSTTSEDSVVTGNNSDTDTVDRELTTTGGGPLSYDVDSEMPIILDRLYGSYHSRKQRPHPEAGKIDPNTTVVIKEMVSKLNGVLNKRPCQRDEGVNKPCRSSEPCIDLTSSRSVLTQLCDRISDLEMTVQNTPSRSWFDQYDQSHSYADMERLKADIDILKRTAAFSGRRQDLLNANVDRDVVDEYDVTLSHGPITSFNATRGVFTAPYDGIYQFSVTYEKDMSVNLDVFIVVTNKVMATTHDQSQTQLQLLTSLTSDQQVWVEISTSNVKGASPITFTFTGFFLHQ